MPNLLTALGGEYVDQFYKKAMFMLGDDVCMYQRRADDENVIVSRFNKDIADPEWINVVIPAEQIQDMSTFAWPRLGYRDYQQQKFNATFYVSSQRSAMRGLKPDFLHFKPTPVLDLLPNVNSPLDYLSSAKIAQTVFNPKFLSFTEGMAKLRADGSPGFALSNDVAISISVSEAADEQYDILFREQVVGHVLEGDVVKVPARMFKRSTIEKLFDGRIAR